MERKRILHALFVPAVIFLSTSSTYAQEEKITDQRNNIPASIYNYPGTANNPESGKYAQEFIHLFTANEYGKSSMIQIKGKATREKMSFEEANRYGYKRDASEVHFRD